MRKRQMRTIAKSMHTLHKKSGDMIKEARAIDGKAEKEFWELVSRLAEKYNCKILLKDSNYMKDNITNTILFKDEWNNNNEIGLNKMFDTSFNYSSEGEINIGLLGNLNMKQLNEIVNLTGMIVYDEIKEPNGFYSYYAFYFDFKDYWNEPYDDLFSN